MQVSEDGKIIGRDDVSVFEIKPRVKASVVTVIMQEELPLTPQ